MAFRRQKVSEKVSLPRQSAGSSDLRFSTPQRKLLCHCGGFLFVFASTAAEGIEVDLGQTLVVPGDIGFRF